MRKILWTSVACVLCACVTALGGSRDAQWKRVTDANQRGLPKTALEELEPILKAALAEKAYGEAVRALANKIALEASLEGNKPAERIRHMEAEIAKAPPETVPLLNAILVTGPGFISKTTPGVSSSAPRPPKRPVTTSRPGTCAGFSRGCTNNLPKRPVPNHS